MPKMRPAELPLTRKLGVPGAGRGKAYVAFIAAKKRAFTPDRLPAAKRPPAPRRERERDDAYTPANM